MTSPSEKNVTLKVITGAPECGTSNFSLEGVCQYIQKITRASDIEFVLVTFSFYTVERPNKGYYEVDDFVPCTEVVPISQVK